MISYYHFLSVQDIEASLGRLVNLPALHVIPLLSIHVGAGSVGLHPCRVVTVMTDGQTAGIRAVGHQQVAATGRDDTFRTPHELSVVEHVDGATRNGGDIRLRGGAMQHVANRLVNGSLCARASLYQHGYALGHPFPSR